MFDVTTIGELLIDFTHCGTTDTGNPLFESNPGGAPANVVVTIARLGGTPAFVGKVGNDDFGHLLQRTLEKDGVDTSGLRVSDEYNTTLAFVNLEDDGERSFTFYRNFGADVKLTGDEIAFDLVDGCKIFHFGSVSLTHDPVRTATLRAVAYAQAQGKVVSFDPNVRPLLWGSLNEAREVIVSCLPYCDVLKVSAEELTFLSGHDDITAGLNAMRALHDIPLILVTLGKRGSLYSFQGQTGEVPTQSVEPVDTTGAGDAFVGAFLWQLARQGAQIERLSVSELKDYLKFANTVGALVTTKRGAIPAIPTLDEVNAHLGS